MGCGPCKQESQEKFQLNTDTPNMGGPDDVTVAAKSGNFAMANSEGNVMNTENLNTETRRLKHLDKKQNFIEHFLREMNKCRTSPSAYADVVEHHIQYIEQNNDPNGKIGAYYVREGMPKIPLTRGAMAFREMAENLRNMQPMGKIELRENLAIAIPEEPNNWTSKQYISDTLQRFKANNKLTSNYKKFNFQYDVGSPFSENSFVIQLVDDTPFKGSRSRNILNPDYAYVGISSQKVKNRHCGYFLFAN